MARATLQTAHVTQTIVNLTIGVDPGTDGHMVVLPPGELIITAYVLGDPVPAIDFALVGYRGADPVATIEAKLGKRPRNFRTPIAGGTYMYSLRNLAPVALEASLATLSDHRQWVHLKMSLLPA
jgi:hypothetical protein